MPGLARLHPVTRNLGQATVLVNRIGNAPRAEINCHGAMSVPLGQIESGYVAPRAGATPVVVVLDQIGANGTESFHATALQAILEALRDDFLARDLFGVSFRPDPRQITPSGVDLRPDGDAQLTITVATGVVTAMRTVASGDRVGESRDIHPDETVNHPLHQRHLDASPVRPYEEGDTEQDDLLRKSELDRYLFFLGRHPGRIVDPTVSAA